MWKNVVEDVREGCKRIQEEVSDRNLEKISRGTSWFVSFAKYISGDQIKEIRWAMYVEYLWEERNSYRVSVVIWARQPS